MLLNVADFPDQSPDGGLDPLQAALNESRDGDRIYLPGSLRYRAPAGGWEVRKSVEIFGDGPGSADIAPETNSGTILHPHSPSTSDHVIRLVAKRRDEQGVEARPWCALGIRPIAARWFGWGDGAGGS
jgi:hypothetical protein